jgi:hypothetical protein
VKKTIPIILLIAGAVLLLEPGAFSGFVDDLGKSAHTVSCDVTVTRNGFDVPQIAAKTCTRTSNGCALPLDIAWGEYKGSLVLQIGAKTGSTSISQGVGLPVKTQNYRVSVCARDDVSAGTLKIYNGDGSQVISSTNFNL